MSDDIQEMSELLACPWCKAEVGQSCRSRSSGRTVRRSHSARTAPFIQAWGSGYQEGYAEALHEVKQTARRTAHATPHLTPVEVMEAAVQRVGRWL